MKKIVYIVIAIAMMIVTMAAATVAPTDSTVGYQAPALTVADNDTVISLQQMQGEYVIIDFWSSTDANSRIANRMHDRMTRHADCVRHLGINMDRSVGVYRSVLAIDGIDTMTQVRPDDASQLASQWRLERTGGSATFLIAPDGQLLAVNPTPEEIEKITKG